jgi:hypothetical protein
MAGCEADRGRIRVTLPVMPAQLVGREYLNVGGGYGSAAAGTSPPGGMSVDHAGNAALSGDLTVDGAFNAAGPIAAHSATLYGGIFEGYGSGGTVPAPTVSTNGDALVQVWGYGRSASGAWILAGGASLSVDAVPAGAVIQSRFTVSTANAAGAIVEALRVDSSQNVGIGMPPVRRLDVNGTFGATGAATLGSTLAVAGAATFSSTFTHTAGWFYSSSNVGGASPSMSQGLAVGWNYTGGGGETDFFNNVDGGGVGGFNFYHWNGTTATKLVQITAAGLFGIGMTPVRTLDVSGTFGVTGAATLITGVITPKTRSVTISSDTIAVTSADFWLNVSPQSGTTDTIASITGGTAGQHLYITAVGGSDVITLTHFSGAGSFVLNTAANKTVQWYQLFHFIHNGTYWFEVAS